MPLRPHLAALAFALLPAAASAGGFEAIAARAERLERLDPFLETFVGRCVDPYTKPQCEAGVAAARKAALAKTFVVRVPDATSLVRPELQGDGFVLLLTPFFDGGGLALSEGTPVKQDASGNPLVNLVPLKGTLPPGTMDLEFMSPFRTGAIELEIVFKPLKTWKLPRKDGGAAYQGVAAKLLGVRVLDARNGNEIASRAL
jgi:hypothetical protein